MTYSLDEIHGKILDNINDSYQKTPGFPTYDITRGIAFGELKLWEKAQLIQEKQSVENLSGDELDIFITERTGLKRKQAEAASGTITVTIGYGTINTGDLFESDGGVQYQSIETKYVKTGELVKIKCTAGGTMGNVATGAINKMPVTLSGIAGVENKNPIEGGTETESDESYRERYYNYIRAEATCGNKAHYLQWARDVPGVGAAACFPLWAGDNTVKVVILNDDMKPADKDIVADVQNYIDPDAKGWGEGTAPVGAYCTVVSAEPVTVDIIATIKLAGGYTLDIVTTDIKASITDYLRSIAFNQTYVSYGRVGAAIIGTDGVADYTALTLNGNAGNVSTTDYNYVAVLGEVIINADD